MGILQALYWRSRERRKECGGREGRKREGEKKRRGERKCKEAKVK